MAEEDTKKTEEEAPKTEEAPKEDTPLKEEEKDDGKMVLHQFPRTYVIPSLSLYCLKLETFLRVTGQEYTNDLVKWKGPSGTAPWMTIEGKGHGDSQGCIDVLVEKNPEACDLDKDLTAEQKAVATSMRLMLEERFFLICALNRFEKKNKKWMAENFMKIPGVPGFLQGLVRMAIGKKLKKKVPGLAAMKAENRTKAAIDVLQSVSDYLASKPYFFGENISSFDCTLFATLAEVMYGLPEDNDIRVALNEKFSNLKEYTLRLKEKYWADWEENLAVKPAPPPPKEKKEKKPKEEKKEEEKKEGEEKKEEEKKEEAAAEEKKDDGEEKKDEEKKE